MTVHPVLRSLPLAVLGAALASASLIAVGLLLYAGPGMSRALAGILAALLGALTAGILAGRQTARADPVEAVRRWWLFVLVAFTLAALFASLWESLGGMDGGEVGQAAGLALLAALPLFAGGGVLGALPEDASAEDGGSGLLSAAVLLGAAGGVLILGFVLFARLSPAMILLLCVVALSGAALWQGRVLDRMVLVRPLPSAGDRAEVWVRNGSEGSVVVVREGGRVRCVFGPEGSPVLALDRALLQGMDTWVRTPSRVLALGSGGIHLARRRARGSDAENEITGSLLVDEPELLASLGAALPEGDRADPTLVSGTPRSTLAGRGALLAPGRWDLVVLDTLVVGGLGRELDLPGGALVRLKESLGPGGVVLAAPLRDGPGEAGLLAGARRVAGVFERVSLYVGPLVDRRELAEVPRSRREAWEHSRGSEGERPAFLVAGRAAAPPWPDRVAGFLRVRVEG